MTPEGVRSIVNMMIDNVAVSCPYRYLVSVAPWQMSAIFRSRNIDRGRDAFLRLRARRVVRGSR